ncbi:MAG: hypothetical protein JXM71_05090, partial [Spirochaetales bacterium]|nr:hypothetical protein [Spirochaetales bacterium]
MSIDKRFIRYYLILGVIIMATIGTVARYGYLALGPQHPARPPASRIVAIRGPIYDREGRILAIDTDLYDVSIWKPSVPIAGRDAFARAVAEATGTDETGIARVLSGDGPDFAYLARRISGDAARKVEQAIEATRMSGVRLDRVAGRVYPERSLAAHLIGFVGTENTGLAGAEAAFESTLSADTATASGGYAYGDAVYLTIDADLQYRLETLGREALEDNAAEALALVAMEARTGDIIAYVSLPDFDPNDFLAADRSTWTDRVSIYAYEPGSVFKVYSMGALMSLGGIDEQSS